VRLDVVVQHRRERKGDDGRDHPDREGHARGAERAAPPFDERAESCRSGPISAQSRVVT
jgi:hypothetical protein